MKRERWLIVISGKSERIYVEALMRHFRVGAVDVVSRAKDPSKLVDEALTINREQRIGEKYARIYLVFDTDHYDCADAINRCITLSQSSNKRTGAQWHTIVSNPCFELWHLLHFRYTDSSFTGKTPCLDLQKRFAKEFASYEKIDTRQAKQLVEKCLNHARNNATQLEQTESTSKTDFWRLVDALEVKSKAAK
jgi:hypothetical protein